MNDQASHVEFYGILGRSTSQNDAIELRFYPQAFSTAPGGKYVLVATFDGPAFREAELVTHLGEEVEVAFFQDRAEIVVAFESLALTLRARTVSIAWNSYDEADFVRRVDELDAAYERLNAALTKAVGKNRRSAELAKELLKRAHVKAQSSSGQAEKQASAIAVLERLIRQIENDD